MAATRPDDRLARRGGALELLRLPAALFGALSEARRRLYDRGWLPISHVDAPVVCVGNLSAGGTGKTPMVAWVVRALQARGFRPGVLARGYGATADGENDEARLLARELEGVPRVLDADRVRGARALLERGADAVVLDDGFQHRRLARDLDLVLVDATRPWGLAAPEPGTPPVRAFLPRGLLREGPRALLRAGAIVITRTDQVEAQELAALEEELEELAPGVPHVLAAHRPRGLRGLSGGSAAPSALRGRVVDLVSGIGNPEAFEETVRSLGGEVRVHRRFGDHHDYGPDDLSGLGADDGWTVTTAKDAVKLEELLPEAWVLDVELDVLRGGAVLGALLDSLPRGARRDARASLHEGLHG
jgi:tetraacyldisaccharide 4'-kinase